MSKNRQGPKTITLYHGTSTKHMEGILKNGLLPRDKTGNSNWDGPVESKAGFVYLTTAYPVYFAFCTAKEENEDLLILRVKVKVADLYPDEDFVAMFYHTHFPRFQKMPLNEVNQYVDMETNKFLAQDSLNLNGKVAVKGVPAKNITGHVVIPQKNLNAIMSLGGDSVPVPLAYRFMGDLYRRTTEALFDGGVDAALKVVNDYYRPMRETIEQLQAKGEVVI